ncbi:unnamed protein product [Strongylus vulgaris]|uniref:Uncharacterized protein n=1 Tax=Strongylus vulgaris TaxID=40348 RepID=A0A3P7IQ34_STRVU|nr:unnamed protein product [Strongylus vulgaris]
MQLHTSSIRLNRLGVTEGSNGLAVVTRGAGESADSSVGVAPPGGEEEGLVVVDEGEYLPERSQPKYLLLEWWDQ